MHGYQSTFSRPHSSRKWGPTSSIRVLRFSTQSKRVWSSKNADFSKRERFLLTTNFRSLRSLKVVTPPPLWEGVMIALDLCAMCDKYWARYHTVFEEARICIPSEHWNRSSVLKPQNMQRLHFATFRSGTGTKIHFFRKFLGLQVETCVGTHNNHASRAQTPASHVKAGST